MSDRFPTPNSAERLRNQMLFEVAESADRIYFNGNYWTAWWDQETPGQLTFTCGAEYGGVTPKPFTAKVTVEFVETPRG